MNLGTLLTHLVKSLPKAFTPTRPLLKVERLALDQTRSLPVGIRRAPLIGWLWLSPHYRRMECQGHYSLKPLQRNTFQNMHRAKDQANQQLSPDLSRDTYSFVGLVTSQSRVRAFAYSAQRMDEESNRDTARPAYSGGFRRTRRTLAQDTLSRVSR